MSAAEGKAHADQAMALLRKAVDGDAAYIHIIASRVPSTRSASGRTSRSCSPSWSRNRPPSRSEPAISDRGGYRIGREWKRGRSNPSY